jgi:hypothetical protein
VVSATDHHGHILGFLATIIIRSKKFLEQVKHEKLINVIIN